MTESEIYEAHAELHNLRTDLANLHDWAERALNVDYHDRQYIAEHLSTTIAALATGEPIPQPPF